MRDFSTYSDEELFASVKDNSERAFEMLYERYWQKLFIVAAKRLESPSEAEEIVQDIFFNIWRLRFTLEIEKSVAAYLSTALKFRVYNGLAKRRKIRNLSLSVAGDHADLQDSVLSKIQVAELMKQLQQAVEALPQQCKIVYRLSREGGYTRREIAHTLDLSEKTVANHLTRALSLLRTVLPLTILFLII